MEKMSGHRPTGPNCSIDPHCSIDFGASYVLGYGSESVFLMDMLICIFKMKLVSVPNQSLGCIIAAL